jgi:hypothetical protein
MRPLSVRVVIAEYVSDARRPGGQHMTFGLEHRPFADFDDEVRIADISALHDLVTSPVTERGLHAWARGFAIPHCPTQ